MMLFVLHNILNNLLYVQVVVIQLLLLLIMKMEK